MPGGGGARPLAAGSAEAHNHRNKRTFVNKGKTGVTGRACERCGVRGRKLTRTSVSASSWKMSETDLGLLPMMTCPTCTARRADIGSDCRASMMKAERKVMDAYRDAEAKLTRGRR